MHSNLDNQDLLRRGSPWQLQDRSPPLTHLTTADPSRSHSSSSLPTVAFYSKLLGCTSPPPNKNLPTKSNLHGFLGEDPVLSSVVPSVTVVLEGRSICHRINLHKLGSYGSLARALRQMFGICGGADVDAAAGPTDADVEAEVELGNAVPGHLVAYEDAENDLLLAGDLPWNDFVRVAKRIRILPIKPKCKRPRTGMKQATI